MNRNHDISKLPKWAISHIEKISKDNQLLRCRNEQLEKANAVLDGKDWFTLEGWGDESRTFYMLRHDHATAVCTVYGKDIMLIGRHRSRSAT